jgi:hypothetical protein
VDTFSTPSPAPQSGDRDRQIAFWAAELAAAGREPALGLSGDAPPSRFIERLNASELSRISSAADQTGVSIHAVMLSATVSWSAGRSCSTRRRIAVQVDRRTSAAMDSVVGPLVTTMPLCFDIAALSPIALMTHVQQRLFDGYLNLEVPIEAAVAEWSGRPEAGGDTGPRLMFVFDGEFHPRTPVGGVRVLPYWYDRTWAPVHADIDPLEAIVNVRWGDDEASLELICNKDGPQALAELRRALDDVVRGAI